MQQSSYTFNLNRIFFSLANLARLTETGELSREINHLYGERKKDSEADNTIHGN